MKYLREIGKQWHVRQRRRNVFLINKVGLRQRQARAHCTRGEDSFPWLSFIICGLDNE